jgi:hypothetical protein
MLGACSTMFSERKAREPDVRFGFEQHIPLNDSGRT